VRLHGHTAAFAAAAGLDAGCLRLSISHSGAYAVAVAVTSPDAQTRSA